MAGAVAMTPRLKTYRLTAKGSESLCISNTKSGHSIRTDVPKASGGNESAAEPVYHLLAALVGCETATASFVARRMKVNVKGMTFDISAQRDQNGALSLPIDENPEVSAALKFVKGTCLVETVPETTDAQLKLLEEQTHQRCPVANMMNLAGTSVEIAFLRASNSSSSSGEEG